jgi:hypothetical protein
MLLAEKLKRVLIAEACLVRALLCLEASGGLNNYTRSSLRGELAAVRGMAASLKAAGRFPAESVSRFKREAVHA